VELCRTQRVSNIPSDAPKIRRHGTTGGGTDTFGLRVNSWPPSSASSRLILPVRDGWETPQRRAARV